VHIIVVSERLSSARTLTLTAGHLLAAGIALFLLVLSFAAGISYFALRHAAEVKMPFLDDMMSALHEREMKRTQEFVRDNIAAIAGKLGQVQAQLVHLDSIGERLASLTGIKPGDVPKAEAPSPSGQGGPLIELSQPIGTGDLDEQIEKLILAVEHRTDFLAAVESSLIEKRSSASRIPTALPVRANYNSSAFGWRIDPFTGLRAMHEGVDFSARVGTPIAVAAGGVVVSAMAHPQYGNLVEVDHGNGYSTRYAHCDHILVTQGQVVKRGQQIATVGDTGRSTGPHLHFEVRYRGAALNPTQFLKRSSPFGESSLAKH
jgi:murein DD-endopeptidase MepM/ murein hydrolase activator NlpD